MGATGKGNETVRKVGALGHWATRRWMVGAEKCRYAPVVFAGERRAAAGDEDSVSAVASISAEGRRREATRRFFFTICFFSKVNFG